MFPCLAARETNVAEINFAARKQEIKSKGFIQLGNVVAETLFLVMSREFFLLLLQGLFPHKF